MTSLYISPTWGEAPTEPICTEICTVGIVVARGVRVDHFSYPTRTRSRWCYPYTYPTRAENFYPYPTRPAGIPVRIVYPCDHRTISVKPMARGWTAHVTHPNVIWLHFDCECRQVDISRLFSIWRKVDCIRRGKNRVKSTLKRLGNRL